MTRIDDIRALVEAEERWRLPMPGVPQAHGEVGIRTWIESSFYLLDLIDQAKEFAEHAEGWGHENDPPMSDNAKRWLRDVSGESNVPAPKEGDR